jgi:hypothetical protein
VSRAVNVKAYNLQQSVSADAEAKEGVAKEKRREGNGGVREDSFLIKCLA